MTDDSRQGLLDQLVSAGLAVASGVHETVIEGASTAFDRYGLPEMRLPSRELSGLEIEALLHTSAFARCGEPEHLMAAKLYARQSGSKVHPVAGFHLGAYAAAVRDDEARAFSSSGGLTTWILRTLLADGRVDGVIHMTRNDAAGSLFSYSISRTDEEIAQGAKTRYYPGSLGRQLRQILGEHGRYAVVGIPSVIYELRLACERDPELRARLCYFVGLICGHQKSTAYADALAWQMGVAPGRLLDIDFRKKLDGRRASDYGTAVHGFDDAGNRLHVVRPASELYGTDWGLGYFKAPFSDFSDDVFNETADVVLGDAWLPEYTSDHRGTNIVLSRSAEIDALLKRGESRGEIQLDGLGIERVVASQGGLVRHGREFLPTRVAYARSRKEFVPRQRFEQDDSADVVRRRLQVLRVRMARQSHLAFESAREANRFEVFPKRMRRLQREYEYAYKLTGLVRRLRG